MAVAFQTEDDYYKDKPLFDFLIDNFDEHTPEGEKSGVSEVEVYSTMVELEVQFLEKDAADYGLFIEFFKSFIVQNDWVADTLWLNKKCLDDNTYCKILRE